MRSMSVYYTCKAEVVLLRKEVRKIEGMTNQQLNAFLEALAKLVESEAKTVSEAAEIIREAKTK